jgi:hypothetical protein
MQNHRKNKINMATINRRRLLVIILRCKLSVKFEEFNGWVGPKITLFNFTREAVGPGERLSVTLRYLVTGDAFSTIAASYWLSDTTDS